MLVAAAAALAVAVGAVVTGQRRSNAPKHALRGSVSRRIALFSSLAGTNKLSGSRPSRRVEMSMPSGEYESQPHSLV